MLILNNNREAKQKQDKLKFELIEKRRLALAAVTFLFNIIFH